MALFPRSSGILLHPTSLPGRYGIGDLGEYAYRFVDWLEAHGQSVWQVLPLGPTSYGDSPYQTLSAFAGNPNLISLDKLVNDGWLREDELAEVPPFPEDHVDYGWIIGYHNDRLHLAYLRFRDDDSAAHRQAFMSFCEDNAHWLDDFALFIALKASNDLRPWTEWPEKEALRDKRTMTRAQKDHADRIQEEKFRQWVFFKQWYELKYYANHKQIRLFGDIPIFVAHDSADVWANRDDYYLDEHGNPTVIAGVPPDYFSPTGQRWGNPLYRWDRMKKNGYRWWISRFQSTLSLVDYIRIDHFRGFEGYWEIPAEEATAVKGEWKPGPGQHFFGVIKQELGELPIIAEDLGVITEEVEAMRDNFNLPGMKVLQFAWSDPQNPFLPHQHPTNSIVYSGTHDNNTTVGWWNHEANDHEKHFMRDYLARDVHEINWTLMRLGMMSSAHTFIAPLQDVLGLGPEGRMNTPGQPAGNWTWRFRPDALDNPGKDRLAHLTWLYQRRPDQQAREYGDASMRNREPGQS